MERRETNPAPKPLSNVGPRNLESHANGQNMMMMQSIEMQALDALIIHAGLNDDVDAARYARRLLKKKGAELEKAQVSVHLGFCELARLYRQLNEVGSEPESDADVATADVASLPRRLRRRVTGLPSGSSSSGAPEPAAPCRGAVGEEKKRKRSSVVINIGQVNIGGNGAFENNRGFFDAGGQARASVDWEDGEDRRSADRDVPHVD